MWIKIKSACSSSKNQSQLDNPCMSIMLQYWKIRVVVGKQLWLLDLSLIAILIIRFEYYYNFNCNSFKKY
jgi:hypothetical protein